VRAHLAPSAGPGDLLPVPGGMSDFRTNPQHPALIGKPEGNPVQIRPAFPDAAAFTERLLAGVQANAARYAEGVRRPRSNFKERARASVQAWTNGVQAAVQRNAFAAGVEKINEDEAIETAATLGAQSYVPGVTGRRAKIQRIMTEVAPAMAAAVQTVRAMPANTDAEREARATAMIRAARVVGQGRRGGR
jgi:hypothetical protein